MTTDKSCAIIITLKTYICVSSAHKKNKFYSTWRNEE
nr:MAG TPA: hypothetical protein [Caudoviricetes sp.]